MAAVFYLWTPKKHRVIASAAVYLLLIVTVAILVVESGGVTSPFIALWMLTSAFAALFGTVAIGIIVAALVGYVIYLLGGGDNTATELLPPLLFSGALPLIVSYIMWHRQADHEAGKDKAYRELANELSQVSGKSDVVINAIADGVIAINNQGIIELINPAAQQIIGWVRQDALGLDYRSVVKLVNSKNEPVSQNEDPISQALLTNKQVRDEKLTLVTDSEKKLLVSIVVSPIGTRGSGAIIVFRDITKEKLEERQQAEFISTASHEMRTPVASIEGYLGLALNPAIAAIDDKARDYITKAHESAQHLGRLFQDLLDVSKAEDNRLSNDPKVVDVVEFAYDVIEGLRPQAQEKGLRMLYKPKPDGGQPAAPQVRSTIQRSGMSEKTLTPVFYANVDNDHLREVIANLVENAIKYTLTGDVVIDITGDDKNIIISVQDSGIGIPAEDMPHLFQKFYRVDNTATREIGGTGLGLYLCRRLAEAMSGRIWAESEYKRGSTFYLEVPRIDHEEAMRLIEEAVERAQDEAQNQQAPPAIGLSTERTMAAAPSVPPQPQTYYQQQQAPVAPVAPQPAQMPVAPPAIPQPTSYQQPAQPPASAYYQPISSIAQNTPLTAIEQNPADYTITGQGQPVEPATPQLYPPNQPPNQP